MRTALAVAVALAVATPSATAELRAQIPADRTYLEFTSPVRIPGAALAPGMYLFVLNSPVGGQYIVDVYTADGARLVATCLAIESTLPRPAAGSLMDFPGSKPATLRAWFHPPNPRGIEFVYDQSEARALFADTGLAIPYAPFKPSNRDIVGAFPIRRLTPLPTVGVANAAAVAPAVTGTGGITAMFEPFDERIGPHDHLTAARRVIAARIAIAVSPEKEMLEILGRQVSRLQLAYRRNEMKDVEAWLRLVNKTAANMLPDEALILARRRPAPQRETVIVVERVQAHVAAFRRAITAPRLASRR